MNRLCLLALFSVTAVAVPGQAPRPQTAGQPLRVMAKGEWQIVRTIGRDTDAFDNPVHLIASEDRFVVSDDNSIKSFRLNGQLEWTFGRQGSGPGEFRHIFDLSLDRAGNLLVYDEALARLTIIGRSGKLQRTVAIKGRADRAVFGAQSGTYTLLTSTADTFARIVDTTAAVRAVVPLPADLRQSPSLAREMSRVLPFPGGYVIPFRWTSRMLVVDRDGAVRRDCTGVDSLSFPDIFETKLSDVGDLKGVRATRIDPRAREATIYATTLEEKIAIEPLTTKGRPRVIDLYAMGCGQYLESRPFPFAAAILAGTQSVLIAMLPEPVPHVVVLRWTPR
jgi:hypothetical protein